MRQRSSGYRPGIPQSDQQNKLPAINLPLRQTDTDVPLHLQTLLDHCYRNGGYDDIDYSLDPEPPLSREDARWVDQFLRRQGKRKRRPVKKSKRGRF